MKKMRIAIVVHGRFHAFDLARGLRNLNHDVKVFTNYPKWAAKYFGIPPHIIKSFWLHGIVSRLAWLLKERIGLFYPEAWLHKMFGRWAARELKKERWDIVDSWSGISEEILQALKDTKALKILVRGSSHIRTQERLLEEEEKRTNISNQNRPSAWAIAREEREYSLADYIRVPSSFVYASFVGHGINPDKLLLIPYGVSIEAFRPSPRVVEKRHRRIMSQKPLCVLYVGALSFQKGIWDMAAVIDRTETGKFKFCLVGPVSSETKRFLKKIQYRAKIIPKQPQYKLPELYAWADLFLFPTIQDGYAQVLAQAQASGLPVISTTNCAGPDMIVEGKTGWVLPIRKPKLFIERLMWCDSHRAELAQMAKEIYNNYKPRDWSDVAKDFAAVCKNILEGQHRKHRSY